MLHLRSLPVASLRSCPSLNHSLLSSGTEEVSRNYPPALSSTSLFRCSAPNSAKSQTPSQALRFWLWARCSGLHPGSPSPCFRTASRLLWVCPNSCTASPRTYVFALRLPPFGGRYKISPGRLGYHLEPSLPQVPKQSCPRRLPHQEEGRRYCSGRHEFTLYAFRAGPRYSATPCSPRGATLSFRFSPPRALERRELSLNHG